MAKKHLESALSEKVEKIYTSPVPQVGGDRLSGGLVSASG
jgi:hypothetical protein